MSEHFDIAVIGSGPGGYIAALKAGSMGATCAIVEREFLGGTCLNYGCIPSKALLASAHLVHHIEHAAEMGVDVQGQVNVNWPVMQSRKDKIIETLRTGVKGLLGARKCKIFNGFGRLEGANGVAVSSSDGNVQRFTASKIILATGSTPARIPGWPSDPKMVCTSDEALHWDTLPKRLLIVGGGVIGCEFACMMQPLGVQVTVVEMLPQLLGYMDSDIANEMRKVFKKRKIDVHLGVKIEDLQITGDTVTARLSTGETLVADRCLMATGRKAATNDIGLETAGLTTDRGFIRVNDKMETPVKGIYCIGDANGQVLLAHAASAHALVAVENALGHERAFDAVVPNAVYTFPEAASVGLTTEQAKERGHHISIGMFNFRGMGKAMAANETAGFCKVVRDRDGGGLLGIHMIGHNVTESIASAGALLDQKASVEEVAETVFAHPTISEAVKEAAEDALSMGLHQPPRKIMKVMAGVA